jgi:ribosomal protein S2
MATSTVTNDTTKDTTNNINDSILKRILNAIRFETKNISSINEVKFCEINGLIVPMDTIVQTGIDDVKLPSNEESIKAFKLLFGTKKRTKVIEDEDSVVSENNKDSETEEEEDFSDTASEEENENESEDE